MMLLGVVIIAAFTCYRNYRKY